MYTYTGCRDFFANSRFRRFVRSLEDLHVQVDSRNEGAVSYEDVFKRVNFNILD